jgi:hypothetical protein
VSLLEWARMSAVRTISNRRVLASILPFVLGLVALALVACDSPPNIKAVTPFPGQTWEVTFDVSGGIDGRSHGLKLDSKGNATFADRRANRTKTATLSISDVDEIHASILAADLPSYKPTPTAGGCADCIDTKVVVTAGNIVYTATANEVNQAPQLAPLFKALNELYDNNQP